MRIGSTVRGESDQRGYRMTRLDINALRRAIANRRNIKPPVHFHSGPQGQPAACFDEHCHSPRLDVS